MRLPRKELLKRLQKIKMLIMDVDGVMTDGGIILGVKEELKKFNVQDGSATKYLHRQGIMTAIISGRKSAVVERRAEELGITEVHQYALKKLPVFNSLLKKYGLSPEEVAYVGDDLPDLPLLKRVGVAFAVANAVEEVKAVAHYITIASGGNGAIREIAELILKAQNKWSLVVNPYLE